jgi:cobalt-precorrin 5A hydrolase
LVLGLGCRKGIPANLINEAVRQALQMVARTLEEVREIATIDLKGREHGLLEWCQQTGVPLRIIPQTLIQERPWITNASAWVREKVGVDGVCEPCALLATFRGRLILNKTALKGVTVAIVEEVPGL